MNNIVAYGFFTFLGFWVFFWGIWDSGRGTPQEIAGINTDVSQFQEQRRCMDLNNRSAHTKYFFHYFCGKMYVYEAKLLQISHLLQFVSETAQIELNWIFLFRFSLKLIWTFSQVRLIPKKSQILWLARDGRNWRTFQKRFRSSSKRLLSIAGLKRSRSDHHFLVSVRTSRGSLMVTTSDIQSGMSDHHFSICCPVSD